MELAALRDALGLDRAGTLETLEQRLAALPVAEVVRLLGERDVAAAIVSRDEDVLTREEYRHAGLIRDLPLPHADPLAAGGPPWLGCGQLSPPSAPLPGEDTTVLRADPSGFWTRRPGASA